LYKDPEIIKGFTFDPSEEIGRKE